jgi:hypothetical protein
VNSAEVVDGFAGTPAGCTTSPIWGHFEGLMVRHLGGGGNSAASDAWFCMDFNLFVFFADCF